MKVSYTYEELEDENIQSWLRVLSYLNTANFEDKINNEWLSFKKFKKWLKKNILEGARQMGLPTNVDMNILFANMNNMVSMMKQQIDKQSAT